MPLFDLPLEALRNYEAPDAEPVGYRGEVVHMQPVPGEDEGVFDVGIRFVEPDETAPSARPSKT